MFRLPAFLIPTELDQIGLRVNIHLHSWLSEQFPGFTEVQLETDSVRGSQINIFLIFVINVQDHVISLYAIGNLRYFPQVPGRFNLDAPKSAHHVRLLPKVDQIFCADPEVAFLLIAFLVELCHLV